MRDILVSLNFDAWALPALLIIPLVGALVTRFFANENVSETAAFEWRGPHSITLHTFVLMGLVGIGILIMFEPGEAGWQLVADYAWIPDWGARFTLAVDGISLFMVLLTILVIPLSIVGSLTQVRERARSYYALLLGWTAGIIGVFLAVDLLLFYVFWELMLIPMYFIIGIWGGERRVYASLKYFVFTFLGSLMMLVGVLFVWISAGASSFHYDHLLASASLSPTTQLWMFGAFFIAFAVKSPLFPLHTWLPDAQHEAPTTAAVALGIKVATYGVIRLAVPFFPAAALQPTIHTVILVLSVVSIVYGALVAMVQPDFKRLVSYSSISHLGFVMLGIFALTVQSVDGAMIVMLSSGLTSTMLFLLVGMLHERRRTGMIHNFGGLARIAPMGSAFLVLAAMGSIGLPGTSGFVGEFLVLLGSYQTQPIFAVVAATGIILAAVYFLWALQRMLFDPVPASEKAGPRMKDMNRRELSVMLILAIAVLWIGIAPGPILRRIEPSAQLMVDRVLEDAAASEAAESITAPGR
ncbi:MAG TPA: NADH-quinone oxidoreductase subunit M [Gemmatimonadales bacterium]|nr:NADH-quinone oxidoreductase subunit M [Gemmatimonadales bacterium]